MCQQEHCIQKGCMWVQSNLKNAWAFKLLRLHKKVVLCWVRFRHVVAWSHHKSSFTCTNISGSLFNWDKCFSALHSNWVSNNQCISHYWCELAGNLTLYIEESISRCVHNSRAAEMGITVETSKNQQYLLRTLSMLSLTLHWQVTLQKAKYGLPMNRHAVRMSCTILIVNAHLEELTTHGQCEEVSSGLSESSECCPSRTEHY